MTYPQATVIAELNANFIPCRLESAKHPDVARKMNARWLPGLVVCDAEERPTHLQVGFLPPAEFLTELAFGRAVHAMGLKRYDDAHALFARVADTPGAERAPEALFWWGISHYRQTKSFADCQAAWQRIVERWPESQWAHKVRYALKA